MTAALNPGEMLAMIMWLEAAYSPELSARAAQELPAGLAFAPLPVVPNAAAVSQPPPVQAPPAPLLLGGPGAFPNLPPMGVFGAPPAVAPPQMTPAVAQQFVNAATVQNRLMEDSATHGGMNEGEIANLTCVLLTARAPPVGNP